MKKILLVASTAALGLAAVPVLAQQAPDQTRGGKFIDYMGVQLGYADLDKFDSALALIISAGKGVPQAPNFFIEGELTTTLSDAQSQAAGVTADANYWTAGVYGVYALPVSRDFAVRGRLGGVYRSLNVDFTPGGSDDDDKFSVSFGVGGIYDLSPRMNLIAEFTRVDEDINHLTAGVQVKF